MFNLLYIIGFVAFVDTFLQEVNNLSTIQITSYIYKNIEILK